MEFNTGGTVQLYKCLQILVAVKVSDCFGFFAFFPHTFK